MTAAWAYCLTRLSLVFHSTGKRIRPDFISTLTKGNLFSRSFIRATSTTLALMPGILPHWQHTGNNGCAQSNTRIITVDIERLSRLPPPGPFKFQYRIDPLRQVTSK